MTNTDTTRLLSILIRAPWLYSFIEQSLSDELEDRGYFSIGEFEVTALGRDFLSQHHILLDSEQ